MLNLYADVVFQPERLESGTWRPLATDPLFVDRRGEVSRRLARIPGFEVLEADAADSSQTALTLAQILGADWARVDTYDGVIPFRARSVQSAFLDQTIVEEPFVEWMKHDPPRCPKAYLATTDDCLVMEDEAREALARGSVEAAERELLAGSEQRLYVCVAWTMTLAERNETFLRFVQEVLAPLGNQDEVRVVFTNLT